MRNIKERSSIKKLLINKISLRILLGTIVIGTLGSAHKTLKTKPLVELSSGIYNNINDEEPNLFGKKIYYFDINSDSNGIVNLMELQQVDTSINIGNLKKIKKLHIDVSNSRICDLNYMPNIEEIVLSNFEHLTEEDKKIINRLSKLKRITYKLNFDYLSTNNDLDISWIKNSVSVYVSPDDININSDLKDLYIYRTLNKLYNKYKDKINFNYFDSERLEDLSRWDKQLTNIVKSFNFNQDTTDEDKIIQIICYVTDKIDYDPHVSGLIRNTDGIIESDKITEYNKNLLKLVLDDTDGYGICCNYAALTNMLGYYSGIKIDYVSGTYNGSNNGHAWCIYNKDGKNMIVDPTFLDSDTLFNIQKLNYDTTGKYKTQESLKYKDYMLSILFSNDDKYKEIKVKELERFNDNNQEVCTGTISYVNTEKDRYYEEIILKEVKLKTMISLITMLLLTSEVSISTIKRKKEKTKKLLIK